MNSAQRLMIRVGTTVCMGLATLCLAAGCRWWGPAVADPWVPERTISLDQNWSSEQVRWFHHVSQGASTFQIPYAWLRALEQPSLFEAPLLLDSGYLSQFGFISSPAGPENPDGLPVGFARDPIAVDLQTGSLEDAVGFTCAACHTGRIRYRGMQVIIQGGPALVDLGGFREALGLAIVYTDLVPKRFSRFARRVLGPDGTPAQRNALEESLSTLVRDVRGRVQMEASRTRGSVEEGFGRLDAIGRIGNTVFGAQLDPSNYAPLTAPVSFPHLWDTPWFDWVQYNGSIRQPMVRNSGEALGVLARVNLRGPASELYRSNVRVDNLDRIERQLAGPAPWQGLRAPRWPEDLLGPIDREKAARGAGLYAELCERCHLPVSSSRAMMDLESPFWTPVRPGGSRELRLVLTDLSVIGTDPRQAQGMHDRDVDLTLLEGPQFAEGRRRMPFGVALARLTERVVTHWYDRQVPAIPHEQRERMNGSRPNDVRAPLAYKARPLDGIWATAPYLHNGSVPDLYSLLGPARDRPRRFPVGSPEFDPVRVGYVTERVSGTFVLDTSIRGNWNSGHEFDAGALGNGRVGRSLAAHEREALIEFLKTL
jgi:hypothetical protein